MTDRLKHDRRVKKSTLKDKTANKTTAACCRNRCSPAFQLVDDEGATALLFVFDLSAVNHSAQPAAFYIYIYIYIRIYIVAHGREE